MDDVLGFHYLQAPSRDSLKRSLQQLLMLGALDRKTVDTSSFPHSIGRLFVGKTDSNGSADGYASVRSDLCTSFDSQQGIQVHCRGMYNQYTTTNTNINDFVMIS